MSRVKAYLLVVLMAFLIASLSSCGDDDDGPGLQDAVQLAQSNDDLSTLVTALTEANLVGTLQGPGPFTIFAPTDAAFDAFIAANSQYSTIQDLLDDETVLTAVLQYHVVNGESFAADLNNGNITSLQGEPISVNVDNGVVLNGNASVTGADNDVSNGVVHVINQVLIPPSLAVQPQNIVELAQDNDDLSTLVDAVTAADLVTTLTGDGPFTVFAPTNEAFENFIAADGRFGTLAELVSNTEVLTAVLKYHVLNGEKRSTDLTAATETTLQDDETIAVVNESGDITLNGNTNVVTGNVDASNGVVHVIDRVLLPPSLRIDDIVSIATAPETEGLDSLVVALTKFDDLVSLLGGEGTFTVFAPDNMAFRGLLETLGKDRISDIPEGVLKRVLQYHVVATAGVRSGQLTDGQTITTALGDDVEIGKTVDAVTINDGAAQVSSADIAASNGVVHIINAVLVPPLELSTLGTVVEIAYFNKDFTTLIAALDRAMLIDDLTSGMDLTVFAPTNAAFEAFITASPDFSSADDLLAAPNLADILLYHVLGQRVLSTALPGLNDNPTTTIYLPTLSPGPADAAEGSTTVSLQIKDGAMLTGDVAINTDLVDLDGGNGIVHVLNGVLVPPTVVQLAAGDGNFGLLAGALGDANLVETLNGTGPFTVFAPTDGAIETVAPLPTGQALTDILLYHVSNGNIVSGNLTPQDNTVTTLLSDGAGGFETFVVNGTSLAVTANASTATIVATDIQGTNGVIHVVNEVLLPTE